MIMISDLSTCHVLPLKSYPMVTKTLKVDPRSRILILITFWYCAFDRSMTHDIPRSMAVITFTIFRFSYLWFPDFRINALVWLTTHYFPQSMAVITFVNSDIVSFLFSYLWFPDLWINVMLISHQVSCLNGWPRFLCTSGLFTLWCQKLALPFFCFLIPDSPLASDQQPTTFLDPMVQIFTVLDLTATIIPPLELKICFDLEYFLSIQRLWPLFLIRVCLLDLVCTSGKCCPF
jgi:hypothetical protein